MVNVLAFRWRYLLHVYMHCITYDIRTMVLSPVDAERDSFVLLVPSLTQTTNSFLPDYNCMIYWTFLLSFVCSLHMLKIILQFCLHITCVALFLYSIMLETRYIYMSVYPTEWPHSPFISWTELSGQRNQEKQSLFTDWYFNGKYFHDKFVGLKKLLFQYDKMDSVHRCCPGGLWVEYVFCFPQITRVWVINSEV